MCFITVPALAADTEVKLPKIFIYTIPDDDGSQNNYDSEDFDAPASDYINQLPQSDDNNSDGETMEEVTLSDDDLNEPEQITAATVLKGYAEYIEDSDAIYLKDDDDQFVLNLKVPQKITKDDTFDLKDKITSKRVQNYSKYTKEEHTVADKNIQSSTKAGNFLFGTTFGQEVDEISMLENSTSLFTKYERDKFSLSSKYSKTMNTTIGTYSDELSFEPEYKLNNYISIKEVLKNNFSKNRKSSELVLSISPFGRHKGDRVRFEVGGKYTINQDNSLYGTQLNFSTKIKL